LILLLTCKIAEQLDAIIINWFLRKLRQMPSSDEIPLENLPLTPSRAGFAARLLVEQTYRSTRECEYPLIRAVICGAEEGARQLRHSGEDGHNITWSLEDCLRRALISATIGATGVASALTDLAISTNEEDVPEDRDLDVALVAAANVGNIAWMELLLDLGADIDLDTSFFGSPLHTATYAGHDTAVKFLLSRGADPNRNDGDAGNLLLHYAAGAGHLSLVQLLLEMGSEPDSYNASGQTPLLLAAAAGHSDVVEFLLDRNTTVSAYGKIHPLTDILRLLLKGDKNVFEAGHAERRCRHRLPPPRGDIE
jgi:ankyrin repeat protein